MDQIERDHRSDAFIKGALLLGITGIIVKVMGAFFKIPLANILGPEGVGYFNSAYPVYNVFIMLATTGLPTALAKIISEQRASNHYLDIERTYKVGLGIMLFIGVVGSFIMFFGASTIVTLVKNEPAKASFMAMAPGILFVSVMSVFRGYFQGFQMMKPFALSQIAEQFFRVVLGIVLAILLMYKGPVYASAGATFGATVGGLAGLVMIYYLFLRHKKSFHIQTGDDDVQPSSVKVLLKRIVMIAVPITLGATVMPLMSVIDLGIVINRLHDIGLGEEANTMYGLLTGYATTLVTLPQVIISAIQISIVPAVAGFYVQNHYQKLKSTIENGIRMALIISLPATAGLVILAQPIMELLYPRQVMYAETTGKILMILGFGVIFLSIFQVTTGILQGLSLQNRPALHLTIGAIVKVILTYVLVGIPSINIYGAAISSIAAYIVASALNIYVLVNRAQISFDLMQILVKPLLSVLVMSGVVVTTYRLGVMLTPSKLVTVLSIFIGILVYFYMILRTQTIKESDYDMLPGGAKLKRLSNIVLRKKGD